MAFGFGRNQPYTDATVTGGANWEHEQKHKTQQREQEEFVEGAKKKEEPSIMDRMKGRTKKAFKSLEDNNIDAIGKFFGVKRGTPEYYAYARLVEGAKETHSIQRINEIIRGLFWVSYVGMTLSFIVKIWGIDLDFAYQLPEKYNAIPEFIRWFIVSILGGAIVYGSHKLSIGFFNKNNALSARIVIILIWGLLMGAGLYFDYRAVTLKAQTNNNKKKEKALQSSTHTNSVIARQLQNQINSLENRKQQIEKTISITQESLKTIRDSIKEYDEVIQNYAKKKKHTKSEWHSMYEAKKQIKSLKEEEQFKLNTITHKQELLDQIDTKIAEKTREYKKELQKIDKEFTAKADGDATLLFGFVLVVELLANATLIGRFIEDANIKQAKSSLEEIKTARNKWASILQEVEELKGEMFEGMRKQIELSAEEMKSLNGASQIYGQAMIAHIAESAEHNAQLTEQLSEVAKDAIKSIFLDISNRQKEQEIRALKTVIRKQGGINIE